MDEIKSGAGNPQFHT